MHVQRVDEAERLKVDEVHVDECGLGGMIIVHGLVCLVAGLHSFTRTTSEHTEHKLNLKVIHP